jgi:hypothetical protein
MPFISIQTDVRLLFLQVEDKECGLACQEVLPDAIRH